MDSKKKKQESLMSEDKPEEEDAFEKFPEDFNTVRRAGRTLNGKKEGREKGIE